MTDSGTTATAEGTGAAAKAVLVTLAAAQFVMILDSSVMNVSIATVAKDLGTTVTGIQTAITLYTLVMASLMITGGRMGAILGRKRAFTIGCVIYACGSVDDRALAQPRGVDVRLVVPRRGRCRVGDAGDRGAGGVELRQGRTTAGVRHGDRGRRDRGRGRSAHRRAVHHLLVVALRVRGRGAHHRRRPAAQPAHRRHPEGGGRAPRPRRHRALGARPRSHRLRDPARSARGAS